jgi:hypothetical protein
MGQGFSRVSDVDHGSLVSLFHAVFSVPALSLLLQDEVLHGLLLPPLLGSSVSKELLFIVLRPAQEFFTYTEMLPVMGSNIWAYGRRSGPLSRE